jgi:hypothetical protein
MPPEPKSDLDQIREIFIRAGLPANLGLELDPAAGELTVRGEVKDWGNRRLIADLVMDLVPTIRKVITLVSVALE